VAVVRDDVVDTGPRRLHVCAYLRVTRPRLHVDPKPPYPRFTYFRGNYLQAGVYTLHVRASEDRGQTWSPKDLLTVTNVTNPALAINDHGKVGIIYQQLTTTLRWETHVRFSKKGAHWDDYVLSTIPAGQPVANPLIGPYLGDYEQLLAQGIDFYGVFCANNTPDTANFPHGVHYQRNANFTTNTLLDVSGINPVAISIDPFFFHVSWDEEKEEKEEEAEYAFGRGQLRVKGLKYAKLEISDMDVALGEDDDRRRSACAIC
jgi:hypothetical protein